MIKLSDEEPILKRKVSFQPTFTFGTLIQVSTMLFLAGGVYYSTKLELANVHKQLDSVASAQTAMLGQISASERRLERVETKIDDDRAMRDHRRNNGPVDDGTDN